MNRDEAIRARCEAATPGPWKLTKDGRYEDHDECRIDLPDDNIELCRYENGEFIAHARNDIPDLLDEVERLRAENCHLMGMTLTEYMDLRNAPRTPKSPRPYDQRRLMSRCERSGDDERHKSMAAPGARVG